MAQPLLDAMKLLVTNGTYTKILTKWGVQDGAITDPKINAPIS